jgi:hypothetical protein
MSRTVFTLAEFDGGLYPLGLRRLSPAATRRGRVYSFQVHATDALGEGVKNRSAISSLSLIS